jgi:predicted flap endonuclease-1-like 5' DNA nuclease
VSDEGPTDAADSGDRESPPERLADVRFVGPSTAETLADTDVGPDTIVRKRVSYRQLTEAGVNPGVAARIRREHSLPWSFDSSGEDLTQRSSQIRGLDDGERAWIAASSGDWESRSPPDPTETDGSGDATEAEAAWRDRSAPEPVTVIDGIDRETADLLAEAGITSVRRLSTVNLDRVADAIAVDRSRLLDWQEAAVAYLD